MIRKIFDTQQESELVLDLPMSLRGRRIEVIAFAIDDEVVNDTNSSVMGDFFGTLTTENAAILHTLTEKSRSEWERDF